MATDLTVSVALGGPVGKVQSLQNRVFAEFPFYPDEGHLSSFLFGKTGGLRLPLASDFLIISEQFKLLGFRKM